MSAAISAQEANDRLTQAFKNQGLAITANSPAVSKLLASQRELGVSNADTRESLLKLINSGKDYKLSVDEMGVALNLARTSGISLGDATKSLVTLQAGSVRSAKQFGIVLPPVTKNVDALKDSHVKLTTEEGRHLLALAKVQDKLATGQAYYDALSQKVKDQGAAFAGTAAGGIAQFHAQLGFLEEQLGAKLLPMFNQLLAWVSAHWPEISAIMAGAVTGVGAAIKGMVTAVQAIIPVVAAVVDWVKQNWPQISATFMEVFNTVKSIVSSAVAIITALWNQFGAQILAQLQATWTFVQSYLSGVFNVIRGIFNVFAGLLSGDWSRVWQGLQQIFTGIWQQMTAVIRLALATIVNLLTAAGRLMLAAVQGPWNAIKALATTVFNGVVAAVRGAVGAAVSAAKAIGTGIVRGIGDGLRTIVAVVKGGLDKIWGVISSVAGLAYRAAIAIGAAIIHGIADGIRSALGSALGAIRDAGNAIVGAARGFLHIGSPSQLMADQVGKPIMEGIAKGIIAAQGLATGAAAQAVQRIKAAATAELVVASPAFAAAARVLGLAAAQGIAMGILGPGKTQVQQAIDALRQGVVDKTASFASGFADMASKALAAFDAKFANWKPPSLGKLAAMQLQDQIKQMTDALGPAVQKAESALAAAFQRGNMAAINQAQTALNSALATAQAQIAAQAASDVASAQAALAAAQASGDPAAIQAAQQALDTAVAAQTAAVAKGIADQRALVEQNLTFRADAEQRTHDAVLAKQRAGLDAQLADLKRALLENPKAWATAQAAIERIRDASIATMRAAGTKLGTEFAAGIRAGIGPAVAAAQALAAAVAAVMPVSSPAKKGPLAVDIYEVGKRWAGDFTRGIAAGVIGNIVGSLTGAPMVGGGGMVAAGAGGGLTVNFHIGTVVGDADAFARQATPLIHRELLRMAGRNGGLALG